LYINILKHRCAGKQFHFFSGPRLSISRANEAMD
jgi:hypothetical protein